MLSNNHVVRHEFGVSILVTTAVQLRNCAARITQTFLSWVPEVFLSCGGNFRCWPKADTSSAVGRSYRGRKVSGTQGKTSST